MGMVQIDIDMPTDCASCWIRQNMGCKIANASGWLNNKRDDKCPLKEQEAVEPVLEQDSMVCGNCGHEVIWQRLLGDDVWSDEYQEYCPHCGQAVKWE